MRPYPNTLSEIDANPRPVLGDITIVIPTVGRPILEACLQAIVAGNTWPARIIVVDQSSSPTVAGWVAALSSSGVDAEHVPSSQRGRAAALNRGVERVRTRFVAVTDDDCFVDPDWLQNIVARLRETPEAIITGRMEPEGDEPVVAVATSRRPTLQRRPRLKDDSLNGGDMGAAISVIERIGMFDEDPCLRSAEDREYAYRALRSGVHIVYAPEVIVRHFGWRNGAERAAQYQAYACSHGGFYGKYLRHGDWFMALRVVVHLLRALRRWLRGVITANPELALNGRAYLTGLLPGIIAGWRSCRPSRTGDCERKPPTQQSRGS